MEVPSLMRLYDMSHDDQAQADNRGCRGGSPPFGAKQTRTGVGSRRISQRITSGATRPTPHDRQDGGHHRAHRCILTRSFVGEDHISLGLDVLLVPFQIGRCGIPSRLVLEEEDQGHYKYRLATTIEGIPRQIRSNPFHPHHNSPPEAIHPLYLFILIPS